MADNDKKLKGEIIGWKVGFAISFTFLMIILIALIVIVVLATSVISFIQIPNIVDALTGAFYNTDECSSDASKCGWVNANPVLPTTFTQNVFSPTIALWCAQMIINLEEASSNGNVLHLPSQIIFVANLQGCPGCSAPYGYSDPGEPLGMVLLDPISRTLYILYRGVVNTRHWIETLLINETNYRFQPWSITPSRSEILPVCSPNMMIHYGFSLIYSEISDLVNQVVSDNADQYDRIVIAGHSLGGCIASISAMNIFTQTSTPIFIYTYGKPRVGNLEYSQCVTNTFGLNYNRLENRDDLIPSVPLSTTPNFSNYNQPYLYEQDGENYVGYQSNWGCKKVFFKKIKSKTKKKLKL